MQTFMLILTILNPNHWTDDSYVVDYGLTLSDCRAAIANEWSMANENPNSYVECVKESN